MKKYLSLIFLSFAFLVFSPIIHADNNSDRTVVSPSNSSNNLSTSPTSILSGKMLIVDMDNDGGVSKQTVLSGSDLILGKINNDPDHKVSAFVIEAISNVQDLAQFDLNHNGTIQRNELAKSNLVLIRFSPDHAINIIPLALSNIQQIHYQGGLTQHNIATPLKVWLETNDNKKFETYYLIF